METNRDSVSPPPVQPRVGNATNVDPGLPKRDWERRVKRDQGVVDWLKSGEWRAAPVVLPTLLAFAIVVTILDLGSHFLARETVYEPLIKYVGWNPSTIYLFSGGIAYNLCISRRLRTRNILVGLIAIWALGNAIHFITTHNHKDFGNPYLMVSPYRPIWTVVIPLLWGAWLMSPRVTKYCVRAEPVRRKGATTA
jgi:hypothetical protein